MKMIKKSGCMILVLALILSLIFADTSFQAEAASGKWKHNSNGYYYVYANGTRSKKGWKTIGGKKYYFNAKGYRVTGWKKIGGKKYHFTAKGVMQTGWRKLSGKKYYFGKNGAMVTGWQKIGKKKYYFSAKGVLNTKTTLKIKGVVYRFRKDGSYIDKKTCNHKWVWKTKTKIVHHDAVTDTYQQPVKGAWTEYIYVKKYHCAVCKKYYNSYEDYHNNDTCYGSYSEQDVLDHTIEHPAEYETITETVEPAWDEEVEVNDYQYCSICGKKRGK